MLAPALALVSAASWGIGDFAGGIATRHSNNLVTVFIAQAVGLAVATLLLFLSDEAMPGSDALVWAALAGVAGTLGLGCFYLALSRGTMGLVAPLTALLAATIPALIGLASGDEVGPLILLGMVAALVAVVVISSPERRPGAPRLATYQASSVREWLLILGAGVGFAAFFLLIDAAHDAGGAVWWPLFMVKLAGVLAVTLAVLVLVPLGRAVLVSVSVAALLMGSIAGLGDLGGNLFFVLASGEGELAVVVVLSSLYPVSTAVLARIFLHERLGKRKMAGVALAIGGVALIGMGSL
ncbi:MAG: EamA family transporter [Chloroflexota bacterium]